MSSRHRYALLSAALFAAVVPAGDCAASGPDRAPVIVDEDWNIDTGGFVVEPYLPILLNSDHVRVEGLTVTSGDNWRNEGAVSLLRFLELVRRPDVPVYLGAYKPLVQTYGFHERWQARHGRLDWNGMWNDPRIDKRVHPTDPWKIIPPVNGRPSIGPQRMRAVDFIIRTVHKYPGKVTIYSGAPLTTIAAAIKRDPELPRLAKRMIFQGASIGLDSKVSQGAATFNLRMDPEAAKIVFSAPWHSLVLVSVPGADVTLTKPQLDRIASRSPLIADYLRRAGNVGAPIFGGPSAFAYIDDPGVARRTGKRAVAVSDLPDETYGRLTIGQSCDPPLPKGMHCAQVVEIDEERAWSRWLRSIARPVQSHHGRSSPR